MTPDIDLTEAERALFEQILFDWGDASDPYEVAARNDERVGQVAQDPSLELLRSGIDFPTALQGLVCHGDSLWILQQSPRARFPVKRFHGQLLVLLQLELGSCLGKVKKGLLWLDQPAVSLAQVKPRECPIPVAPPPVQQREGAPAKGIGRAKAWRGSGTGQLRLEGHGRG